VFRAPSSLKGDPKFVRFRAGQPLGFLSSWPLFALSHHILVWLCADRVYPGRKFTAYALLGDEIVIGDSAVASVYNRILSDLEIKNEFLISKSGGLEFAKKVRIHDFLSD